MKVVVIGASHGGHETAHELLTRYDDVEVTVYEAGDFISFMSCGMELFLEGKVTKRDDVRNFKPADIEQYGGKVLANHLVQGIDTDKQEVTVKNLETGEQLTDSYDKLVISSGVTPMTLPVPGSDLKNVFLMRGRDWATKIDEKLHDDAVQNVVVVGTGYIGIEAAQVFAEAGKKVTVIDMINRPLGNYLDEELANPIADELSAHGVNLHLGHGVSAFEGSDVVSAVKDDAGQSFAADLVIVAAGVKPNTAYLKDTVDLDSRGFIQTNAYLQTSAKNVYAIGDAIQPLFAPAGAPAPIALASTARREARYVVENIGIDKPARAFAGVNGSSALSVFGYKLATTGVNANNAAKMNLDVATSLYKATVRPSFVTDGNPEILVKLTYNPENHEILGGQILSKQDVTAHANTIALAIKGKMTLEDLAEADFFFQPGFDRQWSVLNLAAQTALGQIPSV
ncbi:FAD-dependent oxidoreductase [Fructobacillus sp. M1-13]|uniref:FAD-dependent oxidoreductase n=1 Tax=Fructobacillus papyriferae TaxID=2713171 RepID=A0ABS5QPI0_9LACO|nr:FAD-dependent oxidoreductase [Fructobacillus papyriferae]MBS9335083.1 FAD-dependent oxidoreductase [Fructobacillus papyriferae]MCD2159431.1 FAD-dependent oxidoreductase [Fructobacillus papyriferae]